jgi:hypothetical protein
MESKGGRNTKGKVVVGIEGEIGPPALDLF